MAVALLSTLERIYPAVLSLAYRKQFERVSFWLLDIEMMGVFFRFRDGPFCSQSLEMSTAFIMCSAPDTSPTCWSRLLNNLQQQGTRVMKSSINSDEPTTRTG